MPVGFVAREACPLCESEGEQRLLCEVAWDAPPMAQFLQRFYAGRVSPDELAGAAYRVASCTRCGFVYQRDILDAAGMQVLYGQWIDADASLKRKEAAAARLYKRDSGQAKTLRRMMSGLRRAPRVLDFGMGWGFWCRAARDQGLEVCGFELSARRREYARGMGIDVIDELPSPGAHFDCVYSSQVFEHLPDPRGMLESLCARLAPGGLVYLRVPDGRGAARRLARQGWSPQIDALHPLEHINCFSRRTLIALAARAGLEPASPPLRLGPRNPWGALRREFADRFLTTHVHFRLRNPV